jgi:hypothetical protein
MTETDTAKRELLQKLLTDEMVRQANLVLLSSVGQKSRIKAGNAPRPKYALSWKKQSGQTSSLCRIMTSEN